MAKNLPGEIRPHRAARLLGMHVKTIRRWIAEGVLKDVRAVYGAMRPDGELVVKAYWLSLDEVKRVVEARRQAAEWRAAQAGG